MVLEHRVELVYRARTVIREVEGLLDRLVRSDLLDLRVQLASRDRLMGSLLTRQVSLN